MMERFSGEFEFLLNNRSDRGASEGPASASLRQILYFLLMMPGIILCLNAMSVYPPLDSRLQVGFMLGVFLMPVVAHLLYSVLNPNSTAAQPWKTVYSSASAVLVVFAMGLYLNGGLDRSPANPITTTVVEKTIFQGRRGTRYNLAVSSWRPGRTLEHFTVREPVYDRAVVGTAVTVEVHHGFFGLAWHGKIEPE